MKSFARGLRKNQTDAESLLWRQLRNRQLSGFKFRRQHPVGEFIVDFCCTERQLIIEIDGGQHSWQSEPDRARTLCLESKGYKVVRFWNDQVLTELEALLKAVLLALEE